MESEFWPFYATPPKSMPKGEAAELVRVLKELRRDATMGEADLPKEVIEMTAEYRRLWLIEPLDKMIERYEKILSKG